MKKIVLTGGGTAGHVTPNIALIPALKKEGYEILGISADSMEKQSKFHEKYSFPYDLIADDNKEISRIFGVWKKKKFMGREFMGVVRTTFVFDEEGICKEIIENVKTEEHATQILALS